MEAYLVPTVFGMFLHDTDGKVVAQSITYPNVERATTVILKLKSGKEMEEISNLLSQAVALDLKEITVENSQIAKALAQAEGIEFRVNPNSREIKMFRSMLDETVVKIGVVEEEKDAKVFRRAVALHVAREIISEESKSPDLLVKHAIDAISEIDKNINILSMRLREWMAVFRPAFGKIIDDHEQFAKVLKIIIDDPTATENKLMESDVPEQLAKTVVETLENDIGAPLSETDTIPLIRIANTVEELYKTRRVLEEYIERLMLEVAPNITALVGPFVGARLISMAGSLVELARKTSSTLQVLGAEKALFRSLKTGTAPPKHGVIFQVPELYSAPYWQRGKIARALAGKLAIAARIDAFSDRDMGQTLREAFEKRIEEIRRQNSEPPPPKPKTEKQRPQRQFGKRPKRRKGKRRPQRR